MSPVPLRGSRNFNPRSPCGERPLSGGTTASRGNFNPRSPCGERLAQADSCIHSSAFQSTLSLRRATWSSIFRTSVCPFQSTLSLRRATCSELMILRPSNDFNPRSPCGERQGGREGIAMDLEFQSTLSLRRATLSSISLASPDLTFQSTLSLRRATSAYGQPQGHRQFQSTLSLRRATLQFQAKQRSDRISIHALLAESDVRNLVTVAILDNFNPRSPCGERPRCRTARYGQHGISIHALLAESDPHSHR